MKAAAETRNAAIQAVEENIPVLVTVQEANAPQPFKTIYDCDHPLAIALLLQPKGVDRSAICELIFNVSRGHSTTNSDVSFAGADLDGNFAIEMLELLTAIADGRNHRVCLPISDFAELSIDINAVQAKEQAHD